MPGWQYHNNTAERSLGYSLRFGLTLVLLLTSLLLSACGFRLRGYIELPADLQPLYISSESGANSLSRTLSRQLQQSGVEVAEQRSDARLHLHLSNFGSSERQVVFGAVEEHEITLKVNARAETATGETLFSNDTFETRRQYTRDSNLLARDNLRRDLLNSMESDLIRQLTLRIQAVANENPAITP